jgi:acylglycerol lipase
VDPGAPVEFRVGSEVLHGRLWAAAGEPKGSVVLAHGFNSSLDEFGEAPAWMAAAGYHALAFDQRGFGASGGEPGRTNVDRAVPDIAAAVETMRQRFRGLPVFLVGHSLGGAYAIGAASRGVEVAALAVAQPVDRLFDEVARPLRPFYHLLGKMAEARVRRGLPPGTLTYRSSSRLLYRDVRLARQHGRPDFLAKHSNLGNYQAALTMSTTSWAKGVAAPTLVLSSPYDRVVKPANIRKVYDALPGKKRWVEHGGGHSCFRDLDGRAVTAAIVAWFDEHGAGGRTG